MPCQGAGKTALDLLSTCLLIMEFCFVAVLCSNLGNKNSDAGRIKCSRGPQVPHRWGKGIYQNENELWN